MSKIAVYPGTFDPITNGHLDILTRATKLFDKVILGVAEDNYKRTLFSNEERFELAKAASAHLENVEVIAFDGLLVDFCHQQNACAIVRGLRALSDFEVEFQMAMMNKQIADDLESIFLMTSAKYQFLSSSIARNYAALGVVVKELVPPPVEAALLAKVNNDENISVLHD